MKRFFAYLALFAAALLARRPAPPSCCQLEQQVAAAVQSPHVTVVHFWAPWCSNCKAELAKNGWSTFIETNADVTSSSSRRGERGGRRPRAAGKK